MRLPRPLLYAIGILLVAAVALALYWRVFLFGVLTTDDARLQGDLIDVAPTLAGRIAEVRAREGQVVSRADTLFRLDDRDLRLRVRQAEQALTAARSDLAGAQARLTKAENGPLPEEIQQSSAEAAKLEAQVRLAEQEYGRLQRLADTGSVSQQDLDRSRTSLELAQRSLEEARSRLEVLRQGTRAEDLRSDRAAVASAQARTEGAAAALRQARLALSESVVLAPVGGVVVRRWREPGSNAGPSAPVVTIFDPATLYVDANIEEKHLARVHEGESVEIRLDAYPGLLLRGEVSAILHATQSSFSLVPSEGVSGAFIKVSQRVPIRIRVLDEDSIGSGPLLLPGLSATIRILTRGAAPTAEAGYTGR